MTWQFILFALLEEDVVCRAAASDAVQKVIIVIYREEIHHENAFYSSSFCCRSLIFEPHVKHVNVTWGRFNLTELFMVKHAFFLLPYISGQDDHTATSSPLWCKYNCHINHFIPLYVFEEMACISGTPCHSVRAFSLVILLISTKSSGGREDMTQMDERGLSLAVIDLFAPGMIQNSFGHFFSSSFCSIHP